MPDKRLMVIDGNSLLNRAFYALPPLKNAEGLYTNGVYGFLTMYYKVVEDYKPDYLCVVFDKKTPTFRHKEYKNYKAGRPKTPDELNMQFPILKDILDKLNVYRMELEGFEADDLAGTLAKLGEKKNLNVILVTGDRDYLQLASDKICVLITKKGISEIEKYGKDEVLDRYGLTPEQFIDLKGLMGDKSDNIPGVPGIGEKTGIKLLLKYGSVDNLYNNIDSISGKKLKERLIENKAQAMMSKELARIITNVPINVNINDLKVKEPNIKEVLKIFNKLEFKSLLEKLPNNIEKGIKDDTNIFFVNYKIISDKHEIEKISKKIKPGNNITFMFSMDRNYYFDDKVCGIAIKIDSCNEIYYIDFVGNSETEVYFIKYFKNIFENESIRKLGHNLKKDIVVLFRYGINIKGVGFDSMIGQYLIDPSENSYSLDKLSRSYLNIKIESEEELLGKGKNKKRLENITLNERAKFFSNCVEIVARLENPIIEKIEKEDMSKLYYDVEIPLIKVLADMEFTGFSVDIEELRKLGREFDGKIKILENDIYKLAGEKFNINSPKQLGIILFDKLKLPVIKKTKTGYSTSVEVLDKLLGMHPIIEYVLKYRQLVKLKSTYVDGLISVINKSDGKIHSSFNQTVTNTGRISSTEPNLQNIPIKTDEGRKIRRVFVTRSDEYVLVDADYSQIELRVLAHLSDDPSLKEAFYNNEDIHKKTASQVFGVSLDEVTSLMRSRAKAVNFGIVYGISDFGLSRDLNIPRKEAKLYIDNYFNKYSKVKTYMDDIVKQGKKEGYVTTILNRRRYLPELNSRNFNIRSFGERMAMNTPIQGSAADIIKIAMVKVYKELERRKLKSKLILQVHDELIIEAHKEELNEVKEILKNLMENAVELNIPLKVDMKTGDSWYETK